MSVTAMPFNLVASSSLVSSWADGAGGNEAERERDQGG